MTVTHLFRWSVETHRDRVALHFQGEDWTYRRLGEEARAVACALGAWGLGRESRAAILSSNTPEYLAAYYGSMLGGLSVTPVGVRLPSGDHTFLISHCGARALFFHWELLPFVEAVRSEIPRVERFICFRSEGRTLPDWVTSYDDVVRAASTSLSIELEPEDVALVMYTGGTTGRPRGAVHTHGAWAAATMGIVGELGWRSDDVACAAGPLSHATILCVLPTLLKGGKVAILKDFDLEQLLDLVAGQGVTTMPLFPTMIYMLLDFEQTRRTDLSRLRRLMYGGSPMSPERLDEALNVFGDVFIQLYGQTESLSIARLLPEDHRAAAKGGRSRLSSCGRPAMGVEIELRNDSDEPMAPGEAGEICVRSPYVMREYWSNPQETAEALRGGWLHTGDMACRDDEGYLYIVDRKKDMIITGAFNVYSKEIEDVLSEHPAVAQAAVIGVPDEKWGEAVKACVVLRAGVHVTEGELMEWVRSRKGAVQAPKSVDFLRSMPLTAVLKPDKKVLRAPYWSGQTRSVH